MNLTQGNTKILITEGLKAGLLRNQMAYVLATAYWETGRSMLPIKEMGGEKYLRSKKYYPYFGRGYVQLTWDYNYEKAGNKIGVNLMGANKDKALDPIIAADICIHGMVEGWFTGKKLLDYITLSKSDFVNARKIINGKDKASEIADLAVQYDKLLKDLGYGSEMPTEASNSPTESVPAIPAVIVPVEAKPSPASPVAPTINFIESLVILLTKLFGGPKT